jgi:6-pyruvoyltetrahydropterin/6-carboxytetrahydropterin synthase
MYELEIIAGFSAAHRLREYQGKCEQLHGHNYRVHVTVRAEAPGPGGMVIDFGELKKIVVQILEPLDHSYLNDLEPFDRVEPSAENIAAHLFQEIARELDEGGEMLHSVSVWESETSRATYLRDR